MAASSRLTQPKSDPSDVGQPIKRPNPAGADARQRIYIHVGCARLTACRAWPVSAEITAGRGAILRTLTPHTLELFFPLLKTIRNNGSATGTIFYTRRLLPPWLNVAVLPDAARTESRSTRCP